MRQPVRKEVTLEFLDVLQAVSDSKRLLMVTPVGPQDQLKHLQGRVSSNFCEYEHVVRTEIAQVDVNAYDVAMNREEPVEKRGALVELARFGNGRVSLFESHQRQKPDCVRFLA